MSDLGVIRVDIAASAVSSAQDTTELRVLVIRIDGAQTATD
jgi:hypothetical protein